MYLSGLGDDNVASSTFDALGLDVSGWDWHEWALAGIAGYLVVRTIFRAGKRTKQVVGRRAKKVKSSVGRRKRALKTVFTG